MNKVKIIIISLMLIFTSCEQDINGVVDLEFDEQIFVDARLYAGESVNEVKIIKTLPMLNNDFNENYFVKDADVKLIVDQKEYPLEHFENGNYKNETLIIEAGETYKLIIKIGEKKLYGETTVPKNFAISEIIEKEAIQSAYMEGMPDYKFTQLYAKFKPQEKAAYLAMKNSAFIVDQNQSTNDATIYNKYGEYTLFEDDFLKNTLYSVKESTSENMIEVPALVRGTFDFHMVETIMYAYDEPFYLYKKTYKKNKLAGKILTPIESNPHWNVKGDGFGLFFGVYKKKFSYDFLNKKILDQ